MSISSSTSGRHEHRRERRVPAVVGIERRFAHQTVHADLGLEPAVGVVALDAERRALEPGDFARRGFEQFGFPAFVLAPAQVHAQQHLGPILRLGAAGAGLDVDECVRAVHLAGEHALEFELLDFRGEAVDIVRDRGGRAFVVLADRKIEQIAGLAERIGQRADAADDAFERRALLAEVLRALRVVPDVGVFELARDFFEAFGLRIEVKDTP